MSKVTDRMYLCKLHLLCAAQNADRAYFVDTYSESGAAVLEREMFDDLRRACQSLGFRLVPINGGVSGTEADVVNETIATENQL
jgi:hypothetical protein